MIDQYNTIAEPAYGEFRDRGSKFFAYAFPVYTAEEWQESLLQVKKEHPKARHHCYAYRLGVDKNNFRANDDGEPSGTAGRPILGQIDSFELTNVIVIVVRYFGGTLLGTSGLINAYKLSTAAALGEASIITRLVEDVYRLQFDYSLMSSVMNAVKKLKLDIVKQEFTEAGLLEVAIRQSEVEDTLLKVKAQIKQVSLEEAALIESIDGLEVVLAYTR
ncbi:MAG: YigZ family protein [Saprospiraceae bacterium]|nr:YigZ family protein [Saprospiraceae bacterium]